MFYLLVLPFLLFSESRWGTGVFSMYSTSFSSICQPSCIYIKKEVGVSALYFALVFFRSLGRGSWSRKTDQEIWPHDWLHFWNCCGEEVAEQTVLHHGQYWPAFAALSSLTEWFSFAAPKKDKETFHAIMLCDVNPILKLFGLLCKM